MSICISLVITGLVIYIVHMNKLKRDAEMVSNQNILALNAKLEKYKSDSTVAYRKIASVEDLNAKVKSENIGLYKIIAKNNETVMSQQTYIIQLKSINDSVTGLIITGEKIPDILLGKTLNFTNVGEVPRNPFFQYEIDVILNNPSILKFRKMEFSPFTFQAHIARNSDGVWSGYVSAVEPWVNDYLSISTMNVVVDKDNYLRVENDINHFRLDGFVGGGIFATPQIFGHIGLGVIINDRHLLLYSHGIANNFNLINYGYKFTIFK